MRDAMYIDGTPLGDYGAVLWAWEMAPSLDNVVSVSKNALPILLKSTIGQKTLTATFRAVADDMEKAYQTIARLLARLNRGAVELQMPDHCLYRSVMTAISKVSYITAWIAEVNVTFSAVKHGPYQTVNITASGQKVLYDGTAPAGYRIEFAAPSTLQNITVQGIQLISVQAGAQIVIDGMEKTITQNGQNKFLEAPNLTEFPTFEPTGEPVEVVVEPFVPLKISYYPIYI